MSPVLWPFASSALHKDEAELRRCMPESNRPIDWALENSVVSHSIMNMIENGARSQRRPSMAARIGSVAMGMRRTTKRSRCRVSFTGNISEEIPPVEQANCEEKGVATFLSALPRTSSTCLLGGLAEDDECCGDESVAESDFSSDNTAPGLDEFGRAVWSCDSHGIDDAVNCGSPIGTRKCLLLNDSHHFLAGCRVIDGGLNGSVLSVVVG